MKRFFTEGRRGDGGGAKRGSKAEVERREGEMRRKWDKWEAQEGGEGGWACEGRRKGIIRGGKGGQKGGSQLTQHDNRVFSRLGKMP